MFFLILAIISSALVSIVMRLSTGKVKNNIGMLAANYIICFAIAFLYIEGLNPLPASDTIGQTVALGMFNGFLYLASFVVFQYNVKKNGVVLSAVFMKLGLLVPLVLSIVFFAEVPTWIQILGFAVSVAAIIMINLKPTERGKNGGFYLVLLLLLGGGADAMSKVFEEVGALEESSQFLFYTFAAALVFCAFLLLAKKQTIGKNEIIYGVMIGIPNFFSAKFLLHALSDIPAVVAYPTFSVATILVVSLAGVAAFKEKLSKLQWIAVGAIMIALVFLNI
ncbi:MAG: hypothetical protein E7598_05340 [Ruminococcaceae bacterium]|nr:hypothetical protein [Oscillospiraceae bacterium]